MKTIFLLVSIIFIFLLHSGVQATNMVKVDDCSVSVSVLENDVLHDPYTQWYYDTIETSSDSAVESKATDDWSIISISETLSTSSYCKNTYTAGMEFTVLLENSYPVGASFVADINLQGDEFYFQHIIKNTLVGEEDKSLGNPYLISRYKIIFGNRLAGKLELIPQERIEAAILKIDILLIKYSEFEETDSNNHRAVSQLIALKELLEEYVEGLLLQVCPEFWIDNQMPPIPETGTQYYILDGERRELDDFDQDWVEKNCNLEKQIVY